MYEIEFAYQHESYNVPVTIFNTEGRALEGISAVLDTGCAQSTILISDDLMDGLLSQNYIRKTTQHSVSMLGVGGVSRCDIYYISRIEIGGVLLVNCFVPIDVIKNRRGNPELLFGVDLINKCENIQYRRAECFRLNYAKSELSFDEGGVPGIDQISSF